jgi:hypothetical protein
LATPRTGLDAPASDAMTSTAVFAGNPGGTVTTMRVLLSTWK